MHFLPPACNFDPIKQTGMKRIFLLVSLCVLACQAGFSQTLIKGKVADQSAEPLAGANVFLVGTYDGATTDADGSFEFRTDETGVQTLQVTYLGYDSISRPLELTGGILELNLVLKEQAASLDEVVITAGSIEAANDRKKAVVLSPVDIALTASATADIAGAIATLPGVTRNGESGRILVRGGAAYETKTFMDGLLVQKPYTNTVDNLPSRNRFSPFLFKGTQFSTGGYSAEFGQAMSSALILHTEDLAPETTTGVTLLSLGAGLARTKRWENTSLSVSGLYANLAPYFALIEQDIDWIAPPQSANAEVVFRTKTSDTGMFKAYATGSRSYMKLQYPGVDDPTVLSPLKMRGDNVYANLSYKEDIGNDWLLFGGSAYTYYEDLIDSDFDHVSNEQSLQTRLTLSRYFDNKIKLKMGAEYWRNTYRENFTQPGVDFKTIQLENFLGGFVETEAILSPKWVGRAGIRAEYSGLLAQPNIAPRVSLAYLIDNREQIAMAFGRFYQTPENVLMRRNTNLDFESADHFMLNYQRIKNGLTFRAEAYYKVYRHLVKTDPVSLLANNLGQGYARGVDVFFRDQKTLRNADYWISYSFLDTQRDYLDFPVEATPHFASRHNFSLVYKKWMPKINTAFGATYGYASGRPFNDPNSDSFMAERTPDYHDLSINGSYLTNIGGHFTIFYFSATNVPGFKQTFGYQFSSSQDNNGVYQGRAIQPPARRFFLIAIILSIGQKYNAGEITTDDI